MGGRSNRCDVRNLDGCTHGNHEIQVPADRRGARLHRVNFCSEGMAIGDAGRMHLPEEAQPRRNHRRERNTSHRS